jgi:hypothetical protein
VVKIEIKTQENYVKSGTHDVLTGNRRCTKIPMGSKNVKCQVSVFRGTYFGNYRYEGEQQYLLDCKIYFFHILILLKSERV